MTKRITTAAMSCPSSDATRKRSAAYDRALALKPSYIEALNSRGITLKDLRRYDEALASYDRALALRPDQADALYNRGNLLKELKRFEESGSRATRRPAAITQASIRTPSAIVESALAICDLAARAANLPRDWIRAGPDGRQIES